MTTLRFIKLVLILAPVVFIVDMAWLGFLMKDFYGQEIGSLLRRNSNGLAPRWGAAGLVYLFIPAGLLFFVLPQLTAQSSAGDAILRGALFGFCMYGIYDLTNLSVLEKWTLRITIADMMWGTVLCGGIAWLMQVTNRWLGQ